MTKALVQLYGAFGPGQPNACKHKKEKIFDKYTKKGSKRRWEGAAYICNKCKKVWETKARKKHKFIDEELSRKGIH